MGWKTFTVYYARSVDAREGVVVRRKDLDCA